ncbi:hypothetical protein SADUNF_Sadunf01G0098700 [Salix dunnii]|uniref:Uncharacterized protein n=1 Tax=Salix dunnii TaxID=1413687 RepID=A0A835NAJ4_9ROSI|nr:hypothetical protein SADUNF_Sadunf01G0098700 [Salix dunnii]
MDLNTVMTRRVDQLTKLSSGVLICALMDNSMPSFRTVDNNEILSNIITLGILFGNGMIYLYKQDIRGWPYCPRNQMVHCCKILVPYKREEMPQMRIQSGKILDPVACRDERVLILLTLICSVHGGLMNVKLNRRLPGCEKHFDYIRKAENVEQLGVDRYQKWLDVDPRKLSLQAQSARGTC